MPIGGLGAAKFTNRAASGIALTIMVAGGMAQASDAAMPTADAAPDKSQYTLFNPTPNQFLRDLTTDRPDTTESPFTVDAGHVQIETNLFGYSKSRADAEGTRTDSYEFATTNVRLGLTNQSEINVVWQPYGFARNRSRDLASRTRDSGIGGLDIRAKVNLWGNDTFGEPGSTAFALLPFITLPTDRRNGISPEATEVGLIVPLTISLTDKFGLGLNAGVNGVKDSDLSGRHAEWLGSASLSYAWSDNLGTYYEAGARVGTDDPRGEPVVLGTGLTYKLSENLQLDAGVNFGVTRAADRINSFVGVSARY